VSRPAFHISAATAPQLLAGGHPAEADIAAAAAAVVG